MSTNPGPGATYSPCCLAWHIAGTAKPRLACEKASDYAIEYQCRKCGAYTPSGQWMNWKAAREVAA